MLMCYSGNFVRLRRNNFLYNTRKNFSYCILTIFMDSKVIY